jgi:hypothetical protein
LALAATIALLAGVASLAWRMTQPSADAPLAIAYGGNGAPTASAADAGPAANTPAAVATPTAADAVVFPPRGTPIAEMVQLLQPAADSGNVRAQCRLAAELQMCKFAGFHLQSLLGEAERERRTGETNPHADPDLDAAMLELHRQCLALPADMVARGDAWLAAAAHAGDVESMLHYVDGVYLVTRSSHDFMLHPEFERWRREAPAMLQQLLRAGVPEAPFLLSVSAGGNFGLGGGLIPDDSVQQTAAMLLMRRISGTTHTAPALTGRDPDVLRRAERLAATWHHDYYDDRLVPGGPSLQRMYWMPLAMESEGSSWREPCTD